MNPRISVIIPVYNAEQCIGQTLETLLAQSMKGYEIICVDDGSTDGTASILEKYEEQNSCIRILRQENQGAAVARNNGIDAARGDYLAILDADDLYEPDMLQSMLDRAIECNADIVVCRCDEFNNGDDGTQSGTRRPYPYSIREELLPANQPFSGTDVERDVFKLFIGWSWDKLFRRSFVVENGLRFQPLRTSNDMYFVFSAIAKANSIATVEKVLVHHRRGIGGLAETREKSWMCFHDALMRIREQLIEWNLFNRFEQDYINYCLHASLWNDGTLADATRVRLQAKLVDEWFDEFGVTDKDEAYIYNASDWKKYKKLLGSVRPKVSILIPSLNSIDYYKECIDSALTQDMSEIEIICIDAGSTDGTLDVIASRMKSDPRVRHIVSDMRSYGHQMNLGIEAARGEYMLILESDDYILPQACSYYYNLASDYNLDFIKSDHDMFYGDGPKREFKRRPLSQLAYYYDRVWSPSQDERLLYLTILTQPGLYKLSFLKKNDIRYHESPGASYQDNGFWFQTTVLATRAMYTREAVYMLRRDNPNSSVASKGKVFAMCDEYDFIRNWALERGLTQFLPMCAFRRYGNYKFTVGRIGDWYRPAFFERWARDFKELEEAGELDPRYFHPRTWSSLQEIMRTGSDYYHLEWYQRARANEAKKQVKEANKETKRYRKMAESASFRLGHALIQPARMVKRLKEGKRPLTQRKTNKELPEIDNPFNGIFYQYMASLSDEQYDEVIKDQVSRIYAKSRGGQPNLDNPTSFNEIINWRKTQPELQKTLSAYADGWSSRQLIAQRVGNKYLRNSYGPWKSYEDIDFSVLPRSFVLRCNSGKEMRLQVANKNGYDSEFAKAQIDTWLSGNLAFGDQLLSEFRYVEPCVFAEDIPNEGELEIAAWCFGGSVKYIEVYKEIGQGIRAVFYDTSWNNLPFTIGKSDNSRKDKKPDNLDEVLRVAEQLASGLDFVRICMAIKPNGEFLIDCFDFTPMNGNCNWKPARADWWVGDEYQNSQE